MLSRLTRTVRLAPRARTLARVQLPQTNLQIQLVRNYAKQAAVEPLTASDSTPANHERPSHRRSRKPRHNGQRYSDQLYALKSNENLSSTDILDKLEEILSKRAAVNDQSSVHQLSLGHAMFSRLHELNKDSSVPDSVLFKKLFDILIKYKILDVTHDNRFIATLLKEEKYALALSNWIEVLEYFKARPEEFKRSDTRAQQPAKHKTKSWVVMLSPTERFFYGGLVSYLLSLKATGAQPDPEFIKLIFADSPKQPEADHVKAYLRFNLPDPELTKYVMESWYQYADSIIDFNTPEAWGAAFKAARGNLGARVEHLIAANLERASKKGEDITPETWALIMKIYNVDRNYTKAVEVWNKATKEKGFTPTVDLWNQFLYSNSCSNAPNKELRIESIWKLLNESVVPDEQSYRYLIKGLMSCSVVKVLQVVSKLKQEHPELFTSTVKEDLIIGLLDNGFGKEADRLYRGYQTEEFVPSIIVFNKLLHHFLKKNDLDRATEIIDQMIQAGKSNKGLAPDIATWTTVVDIVLKQARAIGAKPEFIEEELQRILSAMSANGIPLNEQALTMLVSNLTRNPQTSELGWQFFNIMKQRNIRLSNVAYTSMVYSECQAGRMDRALELFQEGLKSGVKLRTQYYNLIFKGYADHPNADSTAKFFQFIKQSAKPDEQPNFFTFYYLLRQALYLEDDQFYEFVLTEMAQSGITDWGKQIPKLLERAESQGVQVPEKLQHLQATERQAQYE